MCSNALTWEGLVYHPQQIVLETQSLPRYPKSRHSVSGLRTNETFRTLIFVMISVIWPEKYHYDLSQALYLSEALKDSGRIFLLYHNHTMASINGILPLYQSVQSGVAVPIFCSLFFRDIIFVQSGKQKVMSFYQQTFAICALFGKLKFSLPVSKRI